MPIMPLACNSYCQNLTQRCRRCKPVRPPAPGLLKCRAAGRQCAAPETCVRPVKAFGSITSNWPRSGIGSLPLSHRNILRVSVQGGQTLIEATTQGLSNVPDAAGAVVEGTGDLAASVFETIAGIIGDIFG